MQFFLITGASKGLGRALTEQALQEGAEVAALSRTISGEKREGLTEYSVDLTDLADTGRQMKAILDQAEEKGYSAVTLINNAGMVEPIKRAKEASAEELNRHYTLNLTAPVCSAKCSQSVSKRSAAAKQLSTSHRARRKILIKAGARIAAQKRGLICLREHSGLNRKMKSCRSA